MRQPRSDAVGELAITSELTRRSVLSSRPRLTGRQLALVGNAASLVGTTAVTAGLGLIYWVLAARHFPLDSVGMASASISAMLLLGSVPVLGLQTLLIGELPRRRGHEASLVTTALIAAGGVGAIVGLTFAVVASHVSPALRTLGESAGSAGIFALGVSLTAITLVVDQALIGLLRGDVQLGRNILFAIAKLLAMLMVSIWLSNRLGLTIYATWVVGNLVSLAGLLGLAALKGHVTWASRPKRDMLRGLGRSAVEHQVLNLAVQAPALVLPVVVSIVLSATTNAYFYTAWMTAGLVFVGPESLCIALFAVGARMSTGLDSTLRLTLGLALLIGLVGSAVIFMGARQLLGLFGPTYASEATWVLRFLVIGVFPLIVKQHYVAISRIRGRLGDAVLLMVVGALLEICLAGIGAKIDGLTGLSVGWVAGLSLEAVLAAPIVARMAVPGVARRHDQA